MNWHERYLRQAGWTHDLRAYLFARCGWSTARRVLEVGCGTGAILRQPHPTAETPEPALYGIDLSASALCECRQNAPTARLAKANALALPFAARQFDITYCHFLLLWVGDPLKALLEMRRVTVSSGHVLAIAEPDYGAREDHPAVLAHLGRLQADAIVGQGAALRRGAELAELFNRAGIRIVETGKIQQPDDGQPDEAAWQNEWDTIETDLGNSLPPAEIGRFRDEYMQAVLQGEARTHVPTYFAWGQV